MEVYDNKYQCSSISPCSSQALAAHSHRLSPQLAEPPSWSHAVTHACSGPSPPAEGQGMKATTWCGAPGTLPASAKKKRKKKAPAPRGFMCGCSGTRSVSVDISAVTMVPTRRGALTTAAPAGEPASASKTTAGCARDADASAEGTPSVDSLLRQLRELERGVRALGVREREEDGDGGGVGGNGSSAAGTATSTARPPPRSRHARSASVVGRLDSESVAVVTESADPLGDFRRSMAQMIVENGITGGAELRELLRRFLALNASCHHHLILRAFADVWEELFAAAATAAATAAGSGSHEAPSHGGSGGRASKRPRGRADTLS